MSFYVSLVIVQEYEFTTLVKFFATFHVSYFYCYNLICMVLGTIIQKCLILKTSKILNTPNRVYFETSERFVNCIVVKYM